MVITVQCPSCATSFPVDPAKVPEGGVNARCSVCSAIFRVESASAVDAAAAQDFEAPEEAVRPSEEAATLPEEGAEPAATEADVFEPVEPEVAEPAATEAAVFEPVEPEVAEPEATEADEAIEADVFEPVEPELAGFDSTDTWVFETEQDLDASALDIEPMGTVESTLANVREEVGETTRGDIPAFETPEPSTEAAREEEAGLEHGFETEPPLDTEPTVEMETVTELPPLESETVGLETAEQPEVAAEREPEAEAPTEPEAPAAKPQGFTFGHRDPHDKARRLARVLVSDMIMYNPDRHERALAGGTLKEDFDDEITKSWREYVDQVGDEIANGTSYWSDALNEVLAKGEQLF